MTDIVEWLKHRAKECLQTNMFGDLAKPEDTRYWEAATEIERLRKLLRLKMLDADHLRERKAELLKEIERTT